MKFLMILITLCSFGGLIECTSRNKTIVELQPCSKSYTGSAKLIPASGKTLVDSLTFCLRIRVKTWSSLIVLVKSESISLFLSPFDQYPGYFQYWQSGKEVAGALDPKKILTYSTTVWNSVCFVYNSLTRSLLILINGEVAANKLMNGLDSIGKFNLSYIGLGFEYFYAYITDFNAWSTALPMDELLRYASGSYDSGDYKPNPDIFNWKNLTQVKLDDKCAKWQEFDAEIISLNNGMAKNPEIISVPSLSRDDAQRICQRLNGETFYPQNASHLTWAKNVALETTFHKCRTFWVPFNKVGNTWVKLDQTGNQENASFAPWPMKELQFNGNCVNFDSSALTYVETQCDLSKCVICQISQQRIIFKAKSDCQDPWGLTDQSYRLEIEQSGNLLFSGFEDMRYDNNGLIKKINGTWSFLNLRTTRENETLFAQLAAPDVIGIKDWNVELCGGKKRIKLTNVSHFFITRLL